MEHKRQKQNGSSTSFSVGTSSLNTARERWQFSSSSSSSLRSSSASRIRSQYTRLRFEYGASLEFKVLYAILILKNYRSYGIEELVANFHNAALALHEAQEAFKDHGEQVISMNNIQKLQLLLDSIKQHPATAIDVRQHLHDIQEEPECLPDGLALEEWYNDAIAFVKHTSSLAKVFNIEEDLHAARAKVRSIYLAMVPEVEGKPWIASPPEGLPDTINPVHLSEIYTNLHLMSESQHSPSPLSVHERFDTLMETYDEIHQLLKRQRKGDLEEYSITNLADTCSTVGKELEYLLGRFGSEPSLKDQHVQRDLDILCQGCCHALVSKAEPLVQEAIAERFLQLEKLTFEELDIRSENVYCEVASLIHAFSIKTPASVAEAEWVKYAPRMLTPAKSQTLMNKLQCLHYTFQDQTYSKTERSRLWLSIWKGLKTTYMIVRNHNFKLNQPDFPVEIAFFNKTTVRNQLELILSAPDALNSAMIENVVAEYCILIASGQESTRLEYGMLKQLSASNVQDRIFDNIEQYTDTEWNNLAVRSIQKCAVRLNHILGGPAFVRRQTTRFSTAMHTPPGDWEIDMARSEKVEPPRMRSGRVTNPPQPMKTPSRTDPPRIPVQFGPVGVTPEAPSTLDPFNNNIGFAYRPEFDDAGSESSSTLQGLHAVSAFDYAAYPFPETRALEVAQSRQISREMSQSGIHSQGALSEDVINRPPRHTWPPGTVSVWAQPLPIDPVSVLQSAWSTWRHGKPGKATLKQPRPHPFITPRKPRKDWVDEHPRLRPLYDQHNRVSKPSRQSSQSSEASQESRQVGHGQTHIPKLRGGGPKLAPAAPSLDPSTNQRPARAAVQISADEMYARTHLLAERIRGFWRTRDNTPGYLLRQHFLVPNNWDVNAAYDAARRFVNYGLLNGNSVSPVNAAQGEPGRCPFNELGVIPGSGLDPTTYGMPTYRGDLPNGGVSGGINGVRSSSVSSTGASRRLMATTTQQHLDPVLQAQAVQTAGNDLTLSPGGPQNPFDPAGLPLHFQIWQDPSGPPSAANQQQLALPNGQPANNLSPGTNANHSNQENMSPVPSIWGRVPPLVTPTSLSVATCHTGACHPCPAYTGLFHHVCGTRTSQDQPAQPATPPVPVPANSSFTQGLGQRSPLLGTSSQLPNQVNGVSSAAVTDQQANPTSTRNARNGSPSLSRSAPGQGSQDGSAVRISPQTNGQANGVANSSPRATPSPTDSTNIAGHNLRNRNRLAQRRAQRDARRRASEGPGPAVSPAGSTQSQPQPPTSTAPAQGTPRGQTDATSGNANVSSPICGNGQAAMFSSSASSRPDHVSNSTSSPIEMPDNADGAVDHGATGSDSDSDFDAAPGPATGSGNGRARGRGRGRARVVLTPARNSRSASGTPAGRGSGTPRARGRGRRSRLTATVDPTDPATPATAPADRNTNSTPRAGGRGRGQGRARGGQSA